MKKKVSIFFVGVPVLVLSVFFFVNREMGVTGKRTADVNNDKLSVVASFYPLAYFAGVIGGDKATIFTVTPSGVEPHDYEPTPQDIAHIENSRLLILNGNGLEAWGDSIRQNIDLSKTAVLVAGEGIPTQRIEEGGQTVVDPHMWLSPPLASKMVEKIMIGFETADPVNKNYYEANASTLRMQLGDMDSAYKTGLANCAEQGIITSHAAFGYLATTYGLRQVPIAGLSPDTEPSAQQLGAIADYAKKNNVKVIFFESLVSPKLAETIATEVGATTLVLDPIEGLSDIEISQGKNYFTEMMNNLVNLETALRCTR